MAWILRTYVKPSGEDVLRTWYDSGTAKVRAKFLSRMKFLKASPRHQWVRPHFDLLHEECKGLGEVRFKADRTEHRPLGFFSPGETFTFVFFAVEKDDSLVPKTACSVGQTRKAEVNSIPERSHECDIPIG